MASLLSFMAKRQKLSPYQLDDLPDEVLLKIMGFLQIKELIKCQVSKRLRRIVNDESLWKNLNLFRRKVPYDFIEKAAENGCQYLSLARCDITGLKKSKSPFNFKYLNVGWGLPGVKELLQNCSSLQKLSVAHLTLNSDDIQSICQSGQTLQVLDLASCNLDLHNHPEFVKDLFEKCTHLTEINVCLPLLPQIQGFVDNLTPTILKVAINGCNLQDEHVRLEHVKKLVIRCNNITHLDLGNTYITNDSVISIIEQLEASLEELNVSYTNVDFATLLQLKSMPALKKLICFRSNDHAEIENLRQQLPNVRINKERWRSLHIACPFKIVPGYPEIDRNWIWEIRAKQQNLFANI